LTDFANGRKRISSSFILTKIGIGIGTFASCYNVIYHFINDKIDEVTFLFSFIIIALIFIYFFINRQIQVDYNYLTETIYIIDKKQLTEIAVPIKRVIGIHYSQFWLGNNHSYMIHYLDDYHTEHIIRLHPKLFDNTIHQIISDARATNPELPVTLWSFGWTIFK